MGLFIKDTKPVMDVAELFKKLQTNPKNPRTMTGDELEKLKHSLRTFPKMLELRPIIYDNNFIILGGNMRSRALEELIPEGFKLKPEYFKNADDLTEAQKKEFVLKDNIPFGEWDYDMLTNEYNELPLEEWGLDPTEWDTDTKANDANDSGGAGEKKAACEKCESYHGRNHDE